MKRKFVSTVIAVGLMGFSAFANAAAATCGNKAATLQARRALLSQLAPVIRDGMTRRGLFGHASDGAFGVFGTSFDWHSSVHAHWSLLSMARVTGDQEALRFVLNRLTPEALSEQRGYLQQDPMKQVPYGQAWLLLLLSELKKHPGGKSAAAETLRAEAEQKVRNWLETTGWRMSDRDTHCLGAYQPWLLSYRLFKQSGAATGPRIESLAQLAAQQCLNSQPEGKDFVDIGSLAMIYQNQLPATPRAVTAINDIGHISIFSNHKVGAAISHSWPYAVQAARGNQAACQEFDAALKTIEANPHVYNEGFQSVRHWVPQLIWYGIWQELGEP